MVLVCGIALVFFSSVLIIAFFRFKNVVATLLGWYIVSVANIVLTAELAGICQQVTSTFFFITQTLILFLSILIWWKLGKPPVFCVFKTMTDVKLLLRWNSIKRNLVLWFLALGVLAAYGVNIVLILLVMPNNYDSLGTHMARVGYWLQHGSFEPWSTSYLLQLIYPFNAQVQILWTILYWGSDQLVEFIQWIAVPVSALAIIGICRLLGQTRQQSLFAALVWCTLPQVLLQSTTTQNDLVSSGLLITSVYFLYLVLKTKEPGAMLLSAMSLGLAIGTKQTIFYILPGIGAALLYFIALYRQTIIKIILRWGILSMVATLLLGSYIYMSNFMTYHNPFGPSTFVKDTIALPQVDPVQVFVLNTTRYSYQVLDLTGVPGEWRTRLLTYKAIIAEKVLDVISIPINSGTAVGLYPRNKFEFSHIPTIHEDEAWFGPLGFLLILPITFYQTISAVLKRNPYKLGLILLATSLYFGILFFKGGWTPYQGRYMILPITCVAAFVGYSFRGTRVNSVIVGGIGVIALVVTLNVLGTNVSKPLLSTDSSWLHDRLAQLRFISPIKTEMIVMIEDNVPDTAVLGVASDFGWDYALRGVGLTRKLVPIHPLSLIEDPLWIIQEEIDFILLDGDHILVIDLPVNVQVIDQTSSSLLLQVRP